MSATETPNGTPPRPMTRADMALHAIKAQLAAMAAITEAASATIALLEVTEPNAARTADMTRAAIGRRPRTEAEADFFGKVRASQTAPDDSGGSNGS